MEQKALCDIYPQYCSSHHHQLDSHSLKVKMEDCLNSLFGRRTQPPQQLATCWLKMAECCYLPAHRMWMLWLRGGETQEWFIRTTRSTCAHLATQHCVCVWVCVTMCVCTWKICLWGSGQDNRVPTLHLYKLLNDSLNWSIIIAACWGLYTRNQHL